MSRWREIVEKLQGGVVSVNDAAELDRLDRPSARDLERRASIPKRFRTARSRSVSNWSHGRPDLDAPRDILVTGGNGVGKTYLAAALAREWSGWFYSVPDLIDDFRAAWSRSGTTEADIVSRLRYQSVVVLDDITAFQQREFELATILKVVNARWVDMRPTVITSCHSVDWILEMDSSLGDRLRDFEEIRLLGESKRGGRHAW